MDESKVFLLIAEGENEKIEFKRELDLETARGKSEFIKDVVSIANSAPDSGYILVGVDDSKLIVGIKELEEERMQQIVHIYISPAVVLRCTVVPIQTADYLSVGVIEVKATNKPHKVTRSIDKLIQNEVFVRHGSVVAKASPDEIFRLYGESRQYIRSAEIHLRLGNLQSAIDAYSKAIDLAPTADLFLARGRAYECLLASESGRPVGKLEDHSEYIKCVSKHKKLANLALKDFSDATSLTDSTEVEKEARLGRLRVCSNMGSGFAHDIWEQDLEWLKAETEGRDYGEVLYLEFKAIDNEIGLSYEPNQAVAALDKAIQLGYIGPDVYHLRALANFYACNYGWALRDIEVAIDVADQTDKLVDYLCFQANILVGMRRFEEAYSSLSQARQRAEGEFRDLYGYIEGGIKDEIVYRYSMAYEFNMLSQQSIDLARAIFQVLTVFHEEAVSIAENGRVMVGKPRLDKIYPTIAHVIREMVGEELLKKYKDIGHLEWGFGSPRR